MRSRAAGSARRCSSRWSCSGGNPRSRGSRRFGDGSDRQGGVGGIVGTSVALLRTGIDFGKPPVEATPLGLPDDGTLTIGPKSSGDVELDYGFIASGGGEAPGGAKLIVTELTITTKDRVIESVIAPLREVLNFRQTLDSLLERGEVFGWDTSGTPEIFELVEQATRDGVPYEFTFGPADRVGVPIAATASCDTTGYCLVEYTVTPPVR